MASKKVVFPKPLGPDNIIGFFLSSIAKVIRYSQKHFNVYYYVSQAESVHFLKRTITDRKDAMNVLLNTTSISDKMNFILDK